jgi:hypothetical protein
MEEGRLRGHGAPPPLAGDNRAAPGLPPARVSVDCRAVPELGFPDSAVSLYYLDFSPI